MFQIKKSNYLVVIFLLMFCRTLVAQDNGSNNESSSSDQVVERPNDETKSDSSDTGNTGLDNQVFIPSEEISEDAPVAFPVDI